MLPTAAPRHERKAGKPWATPPRLILRWEQILQGILSVQTFSVVAAAELHSCPEASAGFIPVPMVIPRCC